MSNVDTSIELMRQELNQLSGQIKNLLEEVKNLPKLTAAIQVLDDKQRQLDKDVRTVNQKVGELTILVNKNSARGEGNEWFIRLTIAAGVSLVAYLLRGGV